MSFKFNPFTANLDYYQDVQSTAKSNSSGKIVYVAQDVGNDTTGDGSILRPYKTIQAGINKAELTAAYYNQIVVVVAPASGGNGYNENLTFSQQGVTLQAFAESYRSDSVVIKGSITINLTGTGGGANYVAASNIVYIKGCVLTATTGNTINFSGTTFQRLFIDGSYIDNTGTGSAIALTNTGTSGGTKSTITSHNTDINNNSASNPTIKLSAGRFFCFGASYDIQNGNASGQTLLIDGASAAGPTANISSAVFTGQVSVSDNTANCYISQATISSGSLPAVVTPASPNTGVISLGNVGITTTATNTITGAGIVALLGQVLKLSTGGDVISTVTQATVNSFPQGALLIGAGATQTANAILTLKNGHILIQQTTAPTSALQAAAGSTATRTLTRATDHAGSVSITPNGTGITTGAQLIITFNKAFANAPIVTLTPTNAAGVNVQPYVTKSASTFTINFNVAGTSGTACTFDYHVIET